MGQTSTGHFDGIGQVSPGSGTSRVLATTSTPGAGTDEIQTLTIGGTPTAGYTFKARFESQTSSTIAWSATNGTLLANIQAALDAIPSLGTNGCVATAGTVTAGIGTVTLTFGSARAKEAVETIVFSTVTSVGTAPTVVNVEATPGVSADFRGYPAGQIVRDLTNKLLYMNTGTATAPTWTKVGLQS